MDTYNAIPAIMHFIWVGSEIPRHLEKNIDLWEQFHPGWDIRIWRDDDLYSLHNQNLFDRAHKIVPRDAIGQFKSDLARYEILHEYGGFYADVDTYPLKSINDSVLNHTEFAVQEDQDWIGNTYLGSIPHYDLFKTIVDLIPYNVERKWGQRVNKLVGPKFITSIWKKYSGYVAPIEWGFPYSYADVKRGTVPHVFNDETYAVHEWNHTQELINMKHQKSHFNR